MADGATYDAGFYSGQQTGSQRSAARIMPLICKVVKPATMVDVGCGVGHWIEAAKAAGVGTAHGIDGPWVKQALVIPGADFVEFNFGEAKAPFRPVTPLPRYDIATSFEFAEHIDEDRAEALVDMFCGLADVVVLGSAAPHQGGTHHVNEQWPSYWAEKFDRRGYAACDFIRPAMWIEDGLEPWYPQNSIVYFKGGVPADAADNARAAWARFAENPPPLVHPKLWDAVNDNPGLRRSLGAVRRAITRRIRR